MFATTKELDNSPLESVQFGTLTTSPDSVQFESLEGKPEPETWIVPPTGAEVSFSDIDGEEFATFVTLKACEAQSPMGLPVTVIV